MTTLAQSYLKVPYDLRPAKQVGRRMIIEGLQDLRSAGVPVSTYHYVGLGSVHFVDFAMFHKLLGIRRLTSVEHDMGVAKRVEFNKPYACVDVVMKPVSDVIPTLDEREKHILWLDYDSILHAEQLQEVWLAATQLRTGSILIVTVDTEPPGDSSELAEIKQYYEEVARRYLYDVPPDDCAPSNLPRLNARIFGEAMQDAVSSMSDRTAVPLFSFVYADGHQMLTLGCMLAGEEDRDLIARSPLPQEMFYRKDFAEAPYTIRVPVLTRKERIYLDKSMPCRDGWTPPEFELSDEDVKNYRDVYRYMPVYAELLL